MGSGRLDRSCNNNAYWVCKWFQNNFVEQRQHVSALHSSIWLANPSLHPATPKALWGLSHPIEELLSQLGFFLDLQGKVVAKLNRSSISRKLPAFDHTSKNPIRIIRQLLVGKDPKQNHPSRLLWSHLCKFMSVKACEVFGRIRMQVARFYEDFFCKARHVDHVDIGNAWNSYSSFCWKWYFSSSQCFRMLRANPVHPWFHFWSF